MPMLLRETEDKGVGNKTLLFWIQPSCTCHSSMGAEDTVCVQEKLCTDWAGLGEGRARGLLSGGQNMFLGLGVGSENFEGRPRGGNRQARISSWMLWNRHTADMEEHTHTTHNTNNHWHLPRGFSVPGAIVSEVSKAQGVSGTWWWSVSSFGDLQRVYSNYGI